MGTVVPDCEGAATLAVLRGHCRFPAAATHESRHSVQVAFFDLHPRGGPVEPPQQAVLEPMEFTRDVVKAAVESFGRLAAAENER